MEMTKLFERIKKTGESVRPGKPLPEKTPDPHKILQKIAEIEEEKSGRQRKASIAIRLDPEVLEFFKGTGLGWQTRINQVLLDYVRGKKDK
jgi:uncharacterized protein (DUF4415 family)